MITMTLSTRQLYNKTSDSYNLRHESPPTRLVRKKEFSLIKKFSKGLVIDFGCGTGQHLTKDVIGLDVSEKMLSLAKEKSSLLVQSNESLPLKNESVNTIHCFMSVFNMIDSLIVKEFYRVLKPGGFVLLSVASVHENHGMKSKALKISKQKLNLKLFTKPELESLFNQFTLIEFDSLFRNIVPKWGNFKAFGLKEKILVKFNQFYDKEKGKIYFLAFQKSD